MNHRGTERRRPIAAIVHALRLTGGGIGLFALWTLWLGLVVLLVFQLYIASANQLALPDWVLRRLETRLAESGLRATFARTSFDPGGRILIEDARFSLPAYQEPVITARAVFVQLNPLMLIVGQVAPSEIRIIGATLWAPVMLSATGRPYEIVRDLDSRIEPGGKAITLQQLSARVGNVAVTARGTVLLPRRTPDAPRLDVGALLTRHYPDFVRQAQVFSRHAENFEHPAVNLELAPSESGATSISATLLASAARLAEPMPVRVANLRASTRVLLLEDTPTAWAEVSASRVDVAADVRIDRLQANIYGRFQPRGLRFEVRELTGTADAINAAGIAATHLSTQIFPRPFPQLDISAVGRVLDAPLDVRGTTDLQAGRAVVRFDGAISPQALDEINRRTRVDVRRFFSFERLRLDQAEAWIGAKWKFEKLTARVRVDGIDAFGVPMTDGAAVIELFPHRFYAPEAFARVGDNFAAGSYAHDFVTRQYRFLLAGRLRPMTLSPWFRDWWDNFFQQLEFPAAPPDASVDVQGVWREGHRTSVFVFADAERPVIRGAEFGRVRTRLFIRPGFFDGLELVGFRPEGQLRGRFTHTLDPGGEGWRLLDLRLDSSVDLSVGTKIVGPLLTSILAPFELANPPTLQLQGRFTGPASPEGAHQQLRLSVRSRGEMHFHHFPLRDVSFDATVDDDTLLLENLEAMFGGGVAGGRARVTGLRSERRLGFDLQLRDSSLGQVASGLEKFFAHQRGEAPAPPGKFLREKASVRLDLAASAEGRYNDPFSFRGSGNANLQGAEIGEVALLGALSELLRFTTLRLTEAHANFRIDGARLVFPEVKLRGAGSAIDAHGAYSLRRRELDFNAKIFPFQESENLIKSVVGAVLTPLSNVFEVKLTGTLQDPQWLLLLGPTNFLRSLSPEEGGEKPMVPPEVPAAALAPVPPGP